MNGYIQLQDLKDSLPPEEYADITDGALSIKIEAAKELIDGHVNRDFKSNDSPGIVKVVSVDLVRIMLADISKKGKGVNGEYSFTANDAAIQQALARLDHADLEDEESNSKKTAVNVMVI